MGRRKSEDTSEETLGAETEMLGKAHDDADPQSASARLRAFEDERFGPEAVRIEGKVERGHGSPFAVMSDEDKARYAALERLVETEQALADAHAALIAAQEAHEAAEAAINAPASE